MKLSILFLLRRNKINARNECPIECRITLDRERKPFSTGLFINPKHWDSKRQLAKPPNDENNLINTKLSLIKNKINQAFLCLEVKQEPFGVIDIYREYKGETIAKEYGLVEFYTLYLEKQKKLVGIELKQSTYDKFYYIKKDVESFIKFQFKKSDVQLKELDFGFIQEFEYYLMTEKFHQQITINKAIQRLKKVLNKAVIGRYLDRNPFEEHKPKKVVSKIVFLTQEELKIFSNKEFASPTLNRVRDCYLFCCYTGLAYKEMFELRKQDIIIKPDGTAWIYKKREKTGKDFSVPLVLPKALEIMEKYKSESDYILPRISNQSFNRILKEIAGILEIPKNLTHHTARKTFASTVLLNNDIPIEVVSKLLGHSKISVTQEYYADVMPEKLSEKLKGLLKKL
ncbi:site-specific integrase [Kaistella sp.]|uniref:site-specific integrase n=1 Tax=Kaistella sp. TaxID=2782235 RepID=UPI002F95837F